MSSDDSRDPRSMAHIWCRACNHCMHTSSHCKRHFKKKPSHQCFGLHCACCNRSYTWDEMVQHLNVRDAHKRAAIVDHPPSPLTASPDRSCSAESCPRFQPYAVPASHLSTTKELRRRSGPLRVQHASVLTRARQAPEAALGAPPASPVPPVSTSRLDDRYNTGFGISNVPPVLQTYQPQPDVSSESAVTLPMSNQPLHIPDASWSLTSSPLQPTLPLAAYMASMYSLEGLTAGSTVSSPMTIMNTDDMFMGSSTPGHTLTSDVGDSPVTSRASSTDTITSRASATTTSDADITQRRPAALIHAPT